MDFNQAINSKLKPILEYYHFDLTGEREDFALFKSADCVVRVAFNSYDNTGLLCIDENPISNKLINAVFNSDIKLEEVTKDTFIDNVILLFEQFGNSIFNSKELINQIGQVSDLLSKQYTNKILTEQSLRNADNAWNNADYQSFANIISDISPILIPASYQQKLNIAKRKL